MPPRLAFVKSAFWDQAEPVTHEAFAELVETLGEAASEVDLGQGFGRTLDLHKTVMEVDMAYNLHRDYEKGRDQFSPQLRQLVERARKVPAVDYAAALAAGAPLNATLDEVFLEYDAVLTPAAPGEAPVGDATGNPVFCTTWTYLGTPAVTLPLLRSEAGMPIGRAIGGKTRQRREALAYGELACQNSRAGCLRRLRYRRKRRVVLMTNLITGIIGIALLIIFMGFMLVWVKAPPLIVICLVVFALLIYDFYLSLRDRSA